MRQIPGIRLVAATLGALGILAGATAGAADQSADASKPATPLAASVPSASGPVASASAVTPPAKASNRSRPKTTEAGGTKAPQRAVAAPATSSQQTPSTASGVATDGSVRPIPVAAVSGMTPAIAANATASAMPARATMPDASAEDKQGAAPFKQRMSVRARVDDGRYSGFHQGGGDQPAGDQQFRPAERVQQENKRLSRERDERKQAPPEAASTPAMRDQSTIVRTQ